MSIIACVKCAGDPADSAELAIRDGDLYMRTWYGMTCTEIELTEQTAAALRDALTQWLENRSNAQR